ncbi:hypothetical protein [Xanthomonas phaseoli]|uniref:hypothetical protein n=1 Tax=Xanthomonas phaseoli TaxID=1985254 RepID=UPI00111B1735|nr:hypothetical protein [Xanthomonas phaseoli]MBO9789385.1 hypothetical protein [Xanthomonas phaseoli pv. dieffenbachiae]MBO9853555.1 hypothetical protein [Xanthomonas phaseoli pv. dieffenbachiae]MBO9887697.1 hypothetical protein [Xanthomonas phaseoli pv. dieffenbachiae]MBO9903381.1 hypothetical protein [Xanthomonas phaseoli pv. dieffenbachiae]MBO9913475.1 hypothetical protein [Xanthomonas phaseoli pv. dieffenbachiae]
MSKTKYSLERRTALGLLKKVNLTPFSDEIPDEACERHGEGRRRSLPLKFFLQKSSVTANSDWRAEFDIWGETKQRRYQ